MRRNNAPPLGVSAGNRGRPFRRWIGGYLCGGRSKRREDKRGNRTVQHWNSCWAIATHVALALRKPDYRIGRRAQFAIQEAAAFNVTIPLRCVWKLQKNHMPVGSNGLRT